MSKKKKPSTAKPATGAQPKKKPTPPAANESGSADAPSKNKSQTADANAGSEGDFSDWVPKSKFSRYVSFALLLGVVAFLAIIFYGVMAKFLVPLFLSALLVVIFRPLHRWMLDQVGGREQLAAILTTAAVLLTVLVPLGILFALAAAEGSQVYRQFNAAKILDSVRQLRTRSGLDLPPQVRRIESRLAELQQDVALAPEIRERHRVAMLGILDAAESLAKSKELPWKPIIPLSKTNQSERKQADPDRDEAPAAAGSAAEPATDPTSQSGAPPLLDPEPSEPSEPPTAWQNFIVQLAQIDGERIALEWRYTDGDESENETRHGKLQQYQRDIAATANAFAQFRTELLGGKMRAWLTDLANPSDEQSVSYTGNITSIVRTQLFKIGGAGASFLGNLVLGTAIMIIGLYFFLLDGPKMIESLKGLSPIDDAHEEELVHEFGRVSRAVVVATLLSALVQGLLAGVGFYFAGLDSVFLLTVLSAVLAMVPFVGAAAVWVPCSLYLYFVDNNLVAAIGLAIYGASVISMADNVIKPFILHGQSNLHPLLALLSVLGGVGTLGPIGILIGPMVVAFLQTLLKILQREMIDIEKLSQSPQASASRK